MSSLYVFFIRANNLIIVYRCFGKVKKIFEVEFKSYALYRKLLKQKLRSLENRNMKHPVPSKLTINPKKLKILQDLEEVNVLGSSI